MHRRPRALVLALALLVAMALAPAVQGQAPGRLAGPDRFTTAAAIAARAFPDGASVVYLARADDFPDALAAGALTDGPVLLVPREGTPPQVVLDELDRQDPDVVVALGGTGAVAEATLTAAAQGRDTDRLAGPDRFTTAAAIAERAFPDGASVVYLARADDFPDALAAGALTDGPVLLVPREGTPPQVVLDELERQDPDVVVALGGTGAVAEATLTAAAQGRDTDRLAGPDRYTTGVVIAARAADGCPTTTYLARGDDFPDALAAGVLTDGPVVLVPPTGAPPQVVLEEVGRQAAGQVIALGGPNAVSDATLGAAAAAAEAGECGQGPPPAGDCGDDTSAAGRISVDTTCEERRVLDPVLSADGRYLAGSTEEGIVRIDRTSGEAVKVSVDPDGGDADGSSSAASISADGRYVAFLSTAPNLVDDDTNGRSDVFVRDMEADTTVRATISSDGAEADEHSYEPAISADGRTVVFSSDATTLVAEDGNGETDVFRHDLDAGTTERMSVTDSGEEAEGRSFDPSVSEDGGYVTFRSGAKNLADGVDPEFGTFFDVHLRDVEAGTTTRPIRDVDGDVAEEGGLDATLSADGRYMSFLSDAPDLVPDDTNEGFDVFVRDLVDETTELASILPDGDQFPQFGSSEAVISADGRHVLMSRGMDLPGDGPQFGTTEVSVRDLDEGTTTVVSEEVDQADPLAGVCRSYFSLEHLTIDGSGDAVAFSERVHDGGGCTGTSIDVLGATYVVDVATGETTVPELDVRGDDRFRASAGPAISGDGRYVAFVNAPDGDPVIAHGDADVSQVFLRDTVEGTTTIVSVAADGSAADGGSGGPSLSRDGRTVAFASGAANLVADDTPDLDVFVRDLDAGTTVLVSAADGDGTGYAPALSGDGQRVAFVSADPLTGEDTDDDADVYVHDLATGTLALASVDGTGAQLEGSVDDPAISADGRVLAFTQTVGGFLGTLVHVRDLDAETTEVVSLDEDGEEAGGYAPAVSADGAVVAFASSAPLTAGDDDSSADLFVLDREAGTMTIAGEETVLDLPLFDPMPSLSDDGQRVTFIAYTDRQLAGFVLSFDVVLHDLAGDTTTVVAQGVGTSTGLLDRPGQQAMSADGGFVAFSSVSPFIVPGDTNAVSDVFRLPLTD